jgi:phage-related protein
MVAGGIDPAAARQILAAQERLLLDVASGVRPPDDAQADYASGHDSLRIVAKGLGLAKCPCPWSHVRQWHSMAAAYAPGEVEPLLDGHFSEIRRSLNDRQDLPKYELKLYRRGGDPADRPFLTWQQRDLSETRQVVLDANLKGTLARLGPEVSRDPTQGEKIRRGTRSVTEFKVRCDAKAYGFPQESIHLRVFFITKESQIVLLHGYDKGTDASDKRQQRELDVAFRRLTDFEQQQQKRGNK